MWVSNRFAPERMLATVTSGHTPWPLCKYENLPSCPPDDNRKCTARLLLERVAERVSVHPPEQGQLSVNVEALLVSLDPLAFVLPTPCTHTVRISSIQLVYFAVVTPL